MKKGYSLNVFIVAANWLVIYTRMAVWIWMADPIMQRTLMRTAMTSSKTQLRFQKVR